MACVDNRIPPPILYWPSSQHNKPMHVTYFYLDTLVPRDDARVPMPRSPTPTAATRSSSAAPIEGVLPLNER